MHFKAHVTSQSGFDSWVQEVKSSPNSLTTDAYKQLIKPTEYVQPQFYASVSDNLFEDIVMKYMMPAWMICKVWILNNIVFKEITND